SVVHYPGFADDYDFDLARVLNLLLDLLDDVLHQEVGLAIVDLIRLDHDADFPAGLDGVGLFHAFEGIRYLFQGAETLDVRLQGLPPGPGPGGAQGVGGGDQHRFDGFRLIVAVVARHGVHHFRRLAVLLQQFDADGQVAAFHLVVHSLANIMEQSGPAGNRHVGPQLHGHEAGQVGDLLGVLEDVLAVAGPEVETPQQVDQFGVEPVHPHVVHGLLTRFADALLHFPFGLLVHLLDAGRVNAPVGHQLGQGDAGLLPADGVEAGQHHGLGRIIDDQVNAGQSL